MILYTINKKGASMKREIDLRKDFEERFNGKLLFDSKNYLNKLKEIIGEENFAKLSETKDFIADGNTTVVDVLKRLVTGLVGYPITPSTPIAEGMAKAFSDGFINVFGEKIFYFQPESELGAMAFLEGAASQGGRFADNTSSQGLTYKMKNLYSVAGKRLPALMTLQTREVNKGSLSIHNSHTDLYAARGTGWVLLMSSNNQEMHYLIPAAFKTMELRQVMLPAIVAGEGFLKSHSVENIKTVSDEFLKYIVGPPNRLFQPDFDNPVLMGTFTDINVTMPTQIKQDYALKNVKKYLKATFNIMNELLGTNLDVVENYRTEGAEYIVVMIGAGAETMKEVIDYYRDKGVPVGMVRPVLFYPACTEEIAFGLQNAKVVTVLEKVAQSNEKFLFKDVNEALTLIEASPELLYGVYGLGNQNFGIEDCFGIVENMLGKDKSKDFLVGIKGKNSIKRVAKHDFKQKEIGITFIGVGAEGVKTSQETLAKIIAESGKYVQTSAKYGASRKGGMVVMNARVSDEPIRNCSNVDSFDILSVFNDKYLLDNSLLKFIKGIKDNGYLIINTGKSLKDILNYTTPEIREAIESFRFNVVWLDATSKVVSVLGRNLPGTPILGVINQLTEILPEEKFLQAFKSELVKKFEKKPEVIEKNLELLNVPYDMIKCSDFEPEQQREVKTEKSTTYESSTSYTIPSLSYSEEDELAVVDFPFLYGEDYYDKFVNQVLIPMQKGEDISWEDFLNIVPAKTSKFNNASLIGTTLPIFNPEKCINCGMCIASCPDNALRVTVLSVDDFNSLSQQEKKLFQKLNTKRFSGSENIKDELYFNINVVNQYCKGCGNCVKACKFDALRMEDKNKISGSQDILSEDVYSKDKSDELYKNVKKNKLLQRIMLKYSGQKFLPGGHSLCPGCGEGIIENLVFTAAEMVRKHPEIIEETYKSAPRLLKKIHEKGVKHMLKHGFYVYTINATGCAEVSCLSNPFNARIYQAGHYGFGTASSAALGARISLFSAFRNYYLDKLTKVIVFGGDGAFYDIGNQGLNFALGEDQDITWIIYNNEAYMNTGFQKSGASRYGSNRSTSPYGLKLKGKEDFHRELVAQAMAIPGVYVARLSLSNPVHCLKVLKEAIAYKGPSLVEFFSPCPTGQGLKSDDLALEVSKMMVESRAWPLLVRKPYNGVDIKANPDYDKVYPESKNRKPATFRDIVNLMGQFTGDEETINDIVRVNERQNIYRWTWLQYLAGVRDQRLSEDEIEKIVKNR
jgi:pyruvate-ferredoxin/flavodoxin oxidoreductase